jgi:hypothetical protein
MTSHYRNLMFGPLVRAEQEAQGSRGAYARTETPSVGPDRLTDREVSFISRRDSFYMATTGAGGWPYIQHRGGPPGFVRILSDRSLGVADFRGNRQYLSVGNLAGDDRAAFFFMDYAQRARLKLIGRVRIVDLEDDTVLAAALIDRNYRGVAERGLVIDVEAYDWNCSQHITPRFTMDEIESMIAALKTRIAELEAQCTG